MNRESEISTVLRELHGLYLKNNEYDEGDLIFYRINYRIAETFGMTKEEAENLHKLYHVNNPRHVSEGFCDSCGRVVTIVPIIYGIQNADMERMKAAESEGRLIIGNVADIKEGTHVAMFGCKICKNPLPKYGKF